MRRGDNKTFILVGEAVQQGMKAQATHVTVCNSSCLFLKDPDELQRLSGIYECL